MSEENLEVRAKEMGWVPKEEFKGDPEKWTDAAAFVENGDRVLPILRKNNQVLHGELTTVRGELNTMKAALENSAQVIEDLSTFHKEQLAEKVKETRKNLTAELVAARKDDDVDTEVKVQGELNRLDAAEAAETVRREQEDKTVERKVVNPAEDPVFQAWASDNPWFKSDKERRRYADAVARGLREEGDKTTGRAFLDKVTSETEAFFAKQGMNGSRGKAEGSNGPSERGGGGGGKSYSDLPAEARAQCDKESAKFVGKSAKWPDMKSWQNYYTETYFAGEQ